MKICGIYSITNLTNNKLYIGLSTNIEQRFSFHKKRLLSGKHKNKHFQSSFDKNGIDNFKFEVIEICEDSMLCDREKYWITHYKSFDREFGYNKTYGGEFGRVSDEVNERRKIKLRQLTIPQEQRDRISKTLSGRVRPRDEIERAAKSCRKCTDAQEQEVVNLFIDRKSTTEISELLSLKKTLVISILRRNGVTKNARKSNN